MWFWLSCTTCSGQKEQVRLDKPAAEYLSWQLFICLFILFSVPQWAWWALLLFGLIPQGLLRAGLVPSQHHCLRAFSSGCRGEYFQPAASLHQTITITLSTLFISQTFLCTLLSWNHHFYLIEQQLTWNTWLFTAMHHSFPAWYANKNCMLT